MAVIFFRTIIIYVLLSVTLRVMGKRQVGELEISELISTLLLSEIAAMPIDDPEIPLPFALIPILLIFSVEILSSFLKNRWDLLKPLFESKPVILILRGELRQDMLMRMRISVNELMSELRLQGIGDIREVDYALLEQNGQLSLIPKRESRPLTPSSVAGEEEEVMHPVILDGRPDFEMMNLLGIKEETVLGICRENRISVKEIFLLTVSDTGDYHLIRRDERRGKGRKR